MHFKLSIPEPCHEDWSQMTPAAQGRFCASCKKEVIDYTQLSRKQIADKVKNGDQICGRYRKDQLETTYFIPEHKPLRNLGIAAAFTSLLALCEPVQAQEIDTSLEFYQTDAIFDDHKEIIVQDSVAITGFVRDIEKRPLEGVRIILNGSKVSTRTSKDGSYCITIPKKENTKNTALNFEYIFYETKTIQLGQKTNTINVTLDQQIIVIGEVAIE